MTRWGINANKALIFGVVIVLAVLFLTAGCITTPKLEEPFTVTHKEGYEVTVVHVENMPLAIESECGQYDAYYRGKTKVTTVSRGCAHTSTERNPICRIKSPNPSDDFNGTWDHEIEHCKGMSHPPARGKLQ